MQSQPTKEMARLRDLAQRVQLAEKPTGLATRELLAEFEAYECWVPYLKIAAWRLGSISEASERLELFIGMARTHLQALDDISGAVQMLIQAISGLSLSFRRFSVSVLPYVIREGAYQQEAILLRELYRHFPMPADQVHCLERLCLILEKKLHREEELGTLYREILTISPANGRALRFLKHRYTQGESWLEAATILERLVDTSNHPEEVFRHALELAGIYLYQLDRPSDALATVRMHCTASPLDTTNIVYDAYAALSDWPGCLGVLTSHLPTIGETEVRMRAITHYRIAQLQVRLGDLALARKSIEEATRLMPSLLEPIGDLAEIYAQLKDWRALGRLVVNLRDRVSSPDLKVRLEQLASLLEIAQAPPWSQAGSPGGEKVEG